MASSTNARLVHEAPVPDELKVSNVVFGSLKCLSLSLSVHALQECYIHNLLRVTVYMPSIRREVLNIIIGKLLKLDVSGTTLYNNPNQK